MVDMEHTEVLVSRVCVRIQKTQFCLYFISMSLSLVVSLLVKIWMEQLHDECPLYANVGSGSALLNENGSQQFLVDDIEYGDKKTCLYCLYFSLTSAIYSFICGLLFLLLVIRRTSSAPVKRISFKKFIFPSLLVNSILFTCQLISSFVLTLGYSGWATNLMTAVNKPNSEDPKLTFGSINKLTWKGLSDKDKFIQSTELLALLTFAQVSSWIGSVVTFLIAMICAYNFFQSIWYGLDVTQECLSPPMPPISSSLSVCNHPNNPSASTTINRSMNNGSYLEAVELLQEYQNAGSAKLAHQQSLNSPVLGTSAARRLQSQQSQITEHIQLTDDSMPPAPSSTLGSKCNYCGHYLVDRPTSPKRSAPHPDNNYCDVNVLRQQQMSGGGGGGSACHCFVNNGINATDCECQKISSV